MLTRYEFKNIAFDVVFFNIKDIDKMVILIHRFWLKVKRIMDEGKLNKYENLNIGENTQYSNDNLDGIAPQLISIGRDCIFAPKSVVLTHDASLVPTTGKYLFSPVVIGDRVRANA